MNWVLLKYNRSKDIGTKKATLFVISDTSINPPIKNKIETKKNTRNSMYFLFLINIKHTNANGITNPSIPEKRPN